jgi:hypothetical protein
VFIFLDHEIYKLFDETSFKPLNEYCNKNVIHGLWLTKYAKSLCCNLEFFQEKSAKSSNILDAAVIFKKTGIQPLGKNSIPDFAFAISNASLRMHSTLKGLNTSSSAEISYALVLPQFCRCHLRLP